MESVTEIVNIIKNDPAFIKHGRHDTWISGSSTVVYPISIWTESKEIIIQWGKLDKRVIYPFMSRIIRASEGFITDADLWETDGSCPSRITFYFD